MKITGYRVENYTMQMDRPIADANNPSGEDLMPASLLWIETDEGITGIAPGGDGVESFLAESQGALAAVMCLLTSSLLELFLTGPIAPALESSISGLTQGVTRVRFQKG